MAKVNFTSARVEAFRCPPDKVQVFIWDSRSPGLGLRATQAGAKSYIFQAKIHGQTVRLTIGDPRSWSIDKVQEEARRLQTLVDSGIDPREHRAEQQAAHEARRVEARRRDVTFGEAWDAYVDARKPFWGHRHYEAHIQHADMGGRPRKRSEGLTTPGPLAAFRSIKLPDMNGMRISEWMLAESERRPTMAALSFRLLRGFIRWTQDIPAYAGMIPEDSYRARAVKEAVPTVKAAEGDGLQREQLVAWFREVRAIPNLVISTYLQGLLITGARRQELAALRWEDVDFKWRHLVLNDKVEGTGGRTIPLPPYLASLLWRLKGLNETRPATRQLARLAQEGKTWEPSPWVFSSPRSRAGKLAEPRIAHNKALSVAGIPHVTIQGLRRSFGTLSEWVECPVGVVAQIQGHKPTAIAEKHYRRRPLDLLRMWHDKIEAWILGQAGIEFQVK